MRMSPLRPLHAAVLAVALAAVPGGASAHGGIPRAFSVVVEPGGDGTRMLLRSDVFGFFHSADSGSTWSWYCAELYGESSYQAKNRTIAMAPGGKIYVAASFNGLRTSEDLCNWSRVPDFEDLVVEHVVTTATDVFVLTSTGYSDGAGIDGRVWRSTDEGKTWAPAGEALPLNFAPASFAVAPSDPGQWYVSGGKLGAGGGDAAYSSDDGGATWTERALPPLPVGSTARIAGVHPTRPEVLVVWADLEEGLGEDKADEIHLSADGGATWKLVWKGQGDLPGFTFTPDGKQLLIGGPVDGLRVADVDAAVTDGAGAVALRLDAKIWGLRVLGEQLYAGHSDFEARGKPRFTLGRSADLGSTLEGAMEICDAQPASCPAGSSWASACQTTLDEEGGYREDYLEGPRCAPRAADAGAGDAGAAPRPRGKASGGCAVGGRQGSAGGGFTLLGALALALGLRRARRGA